MPEEKCESCNKVFATSADAETFDGHVVGEPLRAGWPDFIGSHLCWKAWAGDCAPSITEDEAALELGRLLGLTGMPSFQEMMARAVVMRQQAIDQAAQVDTLEMRVVELEYALQAKDDILKNSEAEVQILTGLLEESKSGTKSPPPDPTPGGEHYFARDNDSLEAKNDTENNIFRVVVFPILPKKKGTGFRQGPTKVSVIGPCARFDLVEEKAKEIVAQLDAGKYDGPPLVVVEEVL